MKGDRIDRAFAVLKGYCAKIKKCDKCRFNSEQNGCILTYCIPCDWANEGGEK